MRLRDRFLHSLKALALPPGPVLVAVSGGADSVVLLDLLCLTLAQHQLDLVVAHVDHGIHPGSHEVADRVARLAAEVGLPFERAVLALGPSATETAARRARYRALREIARRRGAGVILTAHHRDDQRETVLMRLLKGSGPAGLAGMRSRTRDLARPLLAFSRRTLMAWARRRELAWWEDPANLDPRHLRSWIRQDLLPVLEQRLPTLPRNLDKVARQARLHTRAMDQALSGWPALAVRREHGHLGADWTALSGLPLALRLALLQALVRLAGGPASLARLRRAAASLSRGQSGMRADLGGHWRLELAFGRVVIVPPDARPPESPLAIGGASGATVWGPWSIRWQTEPAPARQSRTGETAWFLPGPLAVRPPRAGDRLVPLGGAGHRLAVRCFQDARVPRAERGGWPVIESAGRLAWIPGVCRSARCCPAAGAAAIRVDVQRSG